VDQGLPKQVPDLNQLVILVQVGHDEGGSDQLLERVRWGCENGDHGGVDQAVGVINDCRCRGFLGGEVMVEGALGQPGPFDDVDYPRAAKAEFTEQLDG
jgi:hypothetical protein